jgi:predicted ATPase/DNA-binding winged helix-turn-helix (wHTH) protein
MEPSPETYQFGDFTLDVARGCLLKADDEIKLRPKVFETLKYLVEHAGRLIKKEELMQVVWPDAFVTDDSLVQCTVELRRALDDRDQQLLKTVPRRGYVFTAEVIRGQAPITALPGLGSFGPLEAGHSSSVTTRGKQRGLPVARTSLVGREREVSEAAKLLLRPDVRLLSLTGPGGAGKTRLALAIAASIADQFAAGIQFVGLASITRPEMVATALAKAFDIQQVPNRTVPQLIADQLENSGPFLVLLDNFEQVLAAATIVAETLAVCPALKILVTSRAGLRIYGEQEFPVAPLAQNSAIELFVERAAAVWPAFALTKENTAAITEICARLDGLPLAIELAAARTKVLPPQAMLDRLQSRLQLLTGGARDLPERQQTLRSAIDWSYDLLSEQEQTLFRRLSVFVGGCTLESAEAVCNTSQDLGIDLFEGLSSLVDKNLIQRMDRGRADGSVAEPRFAMLETIREYALERLVHSGEQPAVRRAHAAYCLVLAEEGNPELESAERARWLSQCDREIDNFRFALDWLFETHTLDWGFRLCVALFRFWEMREHLTEGRARLETILRLAGTDYARERARVAIFVGALTTHQGDFEAATHLINESLSIYEELQDQWGVAASLNALAISARDRGDYAMAETTFERSLMCWRTLSDELATARCLHNLANVVKVRGDYGRAQSALREATAMFERLGDRSGAAWSMNQRGDIEYERGNIAGAGELYRRALSAFREAGDRWGIGRSLTDIGTINREQGDYESARSAYGEALEIFVRLGHRRGIARTLEGFSCLALARGDGVRTLTLCAAAQRLRRLISAPLPPAEKSKLDQSLQPAWSSLSESDAKRAWEAGYGMPMEMAIEYSLDQSASPTSR